MYKYNQFKIFEKTFNKLFNCSLKRFIHPIYGFNIIQFDIHIGNTDEISTKEFVLKKYSEEACNLIETLINILPNKEAL